MYMKLIINSLIYEDNLKNFHFRKVKYLQGIETRSPFGLSGSTNTLGNSEPEIKHSV